MSVDRDSPRVLGGFAIVANQSFVAAPDAMHQDLAGATRSTELCLTDSIANYPIFSLREQSDSDLHRSTNWSIAHLMHWALVGLHGKTEFCWAMEWPCLEA
jgi:hypothetical protein